MFITHLKKDTAKYIAAYCHTIAAKNLTKKALFYEGCKNYSII